MLIRDFGAYRKSAIFQDSAQNAQRTHKMPILLNEKRVLAIKPQERTVEVRDSVVKGLILRVNTRGRKVWDVVVVDDRKRRRVRLGTHPEISVSVARKLAEQEKANPGRSVRGEPKTVGDLWGRYRAARQDQMRAFGDVASVWRKWAEPRIGHVRLTDLTIHHGRDLRDYVRDHSGPSRAGAVIRYIRPMLVWAEEEQLISLNPWAGLKARGEAAPRDRVLTLTEWRILWEATVGEKYPLGPFIRALMLSGQRLSEVAGMRWDEIDGNTWTIPPERRKATRPEKAKPHEVPLPEMLRALIEAQPRLGPYVFTTLGDRPISPGSKLKGRLSTATGLENWRFHDVRRTAATLMSESGVDRFIIERVLGHADSSVTAVYDRGSYREQKRTALSRLEGTLAGNGIVGLSDDPLRTAADAIGREIAEAMKVRRDV